MATPRVTKGKWLRKEKDVTISKHRKIGKLLFQKLKIVPTSRLLCP